MHSTTLLFLAATVLLCVDIKSIHGSPVDAMLIPAIPSIDAFMRDLDVFRELQRRHKHLHVQYTYQERLQKLEADNVHRLGEEEGNLFRHLMLDQPTSSYVQAMSDELFLASDEEIRLMIDQTDRENERSTNVMYAIPAAHVRHLSETFHVREAARYRVHPVVFCRALILEGLLRGFTMDTLFGLSGEARLTRERLSAFDNEQFHAWVEDHVKLYDYAINFASQAVHHQRTDIAVLIAIAKNTPHAYYLLTSAAACQMYLMRKAYEDAALLAQPMAPCTILFSQT